MVNIKTQVIIGIAFAIVAIILNTINPSFAIGFPIEPQATQQESFIIAGILAPIGEEFVFRSLLLGLLMGGFILGLKLNPFIAAIVNGLVFSFYHFAAYGASLAATSASFIIAAVFGFTMVLMTLHFDKTKFPIPISSIVTHSIFNIFLLSKFFVVVGI